MAEPKHALKIPHVTQKSMYLRPVDSNEIIKHKYSLKNYGSAGFDNITEITLMLLKHIINFIFESGTIRA